jgi:hypothetical protein
MRERTVSIPDNIFDSVKNMLELIPDLKVMENDSIPEWHKVILDERLADFEKNPKEGISLEKFKEELLSKGLI